MSMFGIASLTFAGLAAVCLSIYLCPLEEDIWGERRKTRNRAATASDWLFIAGAVMVATATVLGLIKLYEAAP